LGPGAAVVDVVDGALTFVALALGVDDVAALLELELEHAPTTNPNDKTTAAAPTLRCARFDRTDTSGSQMR
jgi:hypothetical protein